MALTDLTRISTSGIATGTSLSGAILHGDAHFRGTQVGVTSALFDSSEDKLNFKDNVKLELGNNPSDLFLVHNGTYSQIAGIGDFFIQSNSLYLKDYTNGHNYLKAIRDGAVDLYHDNTIRISTTNHGAVVTGILTATGFSGPTNNTSGIATFYDLRVSNNLTVEGTTTTLDTNLIGVDRVEVGANSNSIVGVAITQSGTADLVNLFDGATKVVAIDDTGKVGIGTDAPTQLIDVLKTSNMAKIKVRTTGAGAFFEADSVNSGYHGLILSSGGTERWLMGGYASNNFTIKDGSAASGDERFTIVDGTGKVGINSTSPSERLDVVGNIKASGTITGSSFSGGLPITDGADNRVITASSASAIQGEANLTFNGSKLVNAGSQTLTAGTAPQYRLNASSADGSDNDRAILGLATANNHFINGTSAGDTILRTTNSGNLLFGVGTSERLRISSGGQVRMNTAGSPSADLHVGGTSAVLNGYFQTSSSTGAYHKYSLGDSGADLGYLGSARQISASGQSAGFAMRSQGHIEFCTGGSTERVRITATGELTMTSTATKEFIAVNSTNNNTRGIISMQGKTSGGDVVTLKIGGYGDTQRGEIFTHSNHGLGFATNNAATQMLLDTSGRLGIQGAPTRALLDVRASGGSNTMLTALFGANEGQTGGTLSDNTDKGARVGLYHYDTDALPYALFTSGSSNGSNSINFGGGTSLMNAATSLGLYTAANTTTATGTRRLYIDSSGRTNISKNGWTGSDMTFGLTVHTGSTSETGPVPDGIMIVSQQNSGNQNSSTGKLMFCGHAQTNGPFLYGDSEQAYGKKGLVFHTLSTANSYSTQLEETARFTYNGRFGLGTGTAVDSLMHIQGNSDSGDEACQLVIEDEDTTSGSKIPSIQFKGNGVNTGRIRGTDTSGITFHTWNGSSQIQRAIIGNHAEGGAFLLNADDRGWATFRHSNNQGLRTHIRQHYAPGNAVSTYNIMRIRRHNWGWGTYKIRLKALYYYGSQETTYYVNGNGAGGNDNYSIVKETAHNNDWSGATVTKSAASTSSPGNSSTSYIDVKVNVPNYMYMIIYIEAYTSQYSTDPSNVGADSYCLL